MWRLMILCLALALPAKAQDLVLGLSESEVAITTTFDGSDILVFGAIKHESIEGAQADLDIIVTVEGPKQPVTVYQKARRLGIWVNAAEVEVDEAPSFYAISTTRPIWDILSATDDQRNQITLSRAIRSVGAPETVQDPAAFTAALMRIRQNEGLYQLREGNATLIDNTLFNTEVSLPANLVEGAYKVSVYLTQDKAVISSFSSSIDVRKAGLERLLYNLAHDQPYLYGIVALAIAIAAGWGASAVFRLFQS
ncbi:TIGR02186 family protein [Nereida sp. MMG025]|uniref:TIGR02186 family protein n=1 Tax=Nereida sp. MMG025 TaxID=2909981 RepID=UPI001F470136|nr:TIGR02186 family protein [Nereida sp. MMG025]MCF6445523.1 TIGR02186 family protein [Nereida sp. MMG025]